MYKDDEERLTDIILGEAVMVLLKDDASINSANLLRLLHSMSASEKDTFRQQACRSAIAELRNYSFFETEETGADQPGRDDMSHLFTSDGPPDGSKKH
ncbi:hypothetical protein SD961_18235 [Erwinia sp. MMLR14_017]|uniref:hypothetical protein n=1 Tax=Erwinia sp. MMLR14_017 TaxID=3093842 RepID=UPI0029906B26|nr:hypothetical protein [Erwinia sp. MMLR14_017]MDW8847799.1 hypothetical protein [Erwinia sp. MMLR14_017]